MNFFRLPFAGDRSHSDTVLCHQGSNGYYWSSSPLGGGSVHARRLYLNSSGVRAHGRNYRDYGFSVRCFKNSYVAPESYNLITRSCGIGYSQKGDRCVKSFTLTFS